MAFCAGAADAALAAVTSGGTIPDTADYTVMLEPQAHVVGTVHEDFAAESIPGDVFQLGNTSYRIMRVERGTVRVEDAKGAPPSIPFWLGEAPGRTVEFSQSLSRLRETIAARLDQGGREAAIAWLVDEVGISFAAAEQIVDYLAAAKAALTQLPTCNSGRARTLLRRVRRDAADRARAARQPHQPRVGLGAAQALLPQVRFRAAGGRDRGCDRAVAREQPQLSAAGCGALPFRQHRSTVAGAGAAGRADVRHALALERRLCAGVAALSRRAQGRTAAAAHGVRGPARDDFPGSGGVRREHRR